MISPGNGAAARAGRSFRIAIVGAGTMRGKEVAEIIHDRNFPAIDVKLLDEDDSLGKLETAGDEVTFIQNVSAEQFEHADFTFFAADSASTKKHWKRVRDAGSTLIDLTSALEGQPNASVRSPWVERQRSHTPTMELQPGPVVVAHPVSITLGLLLLRLKTISSVDHASVTVFQPASEGGQKSMDELHEQTVNLLSFQPLPKAVFDAQTAFNMVTRFGENSQIRLADSEERISRHYQAIAGSEAPATSLFLVQAPIFHGYAMALNVQLDEKLTLEQVSSALTGEHISIPTQADEPPSNVSVAGQGDIQISISADGNRPGSFWVWAAADNLRVSAVNAVECAETMTASRPQGKIQ